MKPEYALYKNEESTLHWARSRFVVRQGLVSLNRVAKFFVSTCSSTFIIKTFRSKASVRNWIQNTHGTKK